MSCLGGTMGLMGMGVSSGVFVKSGLLTDMQRVELVL